MRREFWQDLKRSFDMTDLGLLHYCLGLEVWQTHHRIFVYKRKYAKTLIEKSHMNGCKPMQTPMEPDLVGTAPLITAFGARSNLDWPCFPSDPTGRVGIITLGFQVISYGPPLWHSRIPMNGFFITPIQELSLSRESFISIRYLFPFELTEIKLAHFVYQVVLPYSFWLVKCSDLLALYLKANAFNFGRYGISGMSERFEVAGSKHRVCCLLHWGCCTLTDRPLVTSFGLFLAWPSTLSQLSQSPLPLV